MADNDKKDIDPLDDDSVLSPVTYEEDDRWMAEGIGGYRMPVFEGIRDDSGSPVQPVQLKPDTRFRFRCHRGVSCWNRCCHGADITLTPYDILTLARYFSVRPRDIVADFAVPAIHEASGMPVPKLVMRGKDGKGPCVFLDEEEGCKVYEARPATCRYYPLGMAAMKMKGHEQKEEMYFLVKEDYCKGHEEPREQTVEQYRKKQGVELYDMFNERWVEILMKAASWRSVGGPYGKAIPKPMLQMFYMICTDIDKFREFVFTTTFLERYEVPEDVVEAFRKSDETLMLFGFDWLKHVIFGEETVKLRDEVLADALAEARDNWMKYGEMRNTWKYKGRRDKDGNVVREKAGEHKGEAGENG
jgi:hypothetical protein